MKLLDYIKGLRKGKDAHWLEKESMKDSFLADALDGYSQVKGNHEQQIRQLRRQIASRCATRKSRYLLSWSIAACLMIGFGISYYFIYLKDNKMDEYWVENSSQIARTPDATPQPALIPEVRKDSSVHPAVTSKSKKQDLIAKTHPTTVPKTEATVSATTSQEEKAEVLIVATDQAEENEDTNNRNEAAATHYKAKAVSRAAQNLTQNRLAIDTNRIVRGKVVDENGEVLVGASISVNGSGIGTASDLNGEFALKDIKDKEVTASYIGYTSVTLPVDSTNYVLIAMHEDKNSSLDEVVVTGIATQKKATVVGSISTVDTEKLRKPIEPQPVIGEKEFKKYLKKNLIRPTDVCKDAKGEVTVTFLVDSKGRPCSITVIKGLCESADKEAIRLIDEGPDWTLGSQLVEIRIEF